MVERHYNKHETVEVRVRVSPAAANILRRDTLNTTTSIASLAGRILTNAVLQIENSRKVKEAEDRFARLKGAPEARTVLEMSKTFTAQQISAIMRIPYKQVMAELGKQVDEAVNIAHVMGDHPLVSHDAEDMPSTFGSQP